MTIAPTSQTFLSSSGWFENDTVKDLSFSQMLSFRAQVEAIETVYMQSMKHLNQLPHEVSKRLSLGKFHITEDVHLEDFWFSWNRVFIATDIVKFALERRHDDQIDLLKEMHEHFEAKKQQMEANLLEYSQTLPEYMNYNKCCKIEFTIELINTLKEIGAENVFLPSTITSNTYHLRNQDVRRQLGRIVCRILGPTDHGKVLSDAIEVLKIYGLGDSQLRQAIKQAKDTTVRLLEGTFHGQKKRDPIDSTIRPKANAHRD